MASTFSVGTTVVSPLVVDGWQSTRSSRNVIQPVIGGGVDAFLYPAAPRSGTLTAVFTSLADAIVLEQMLAMGKVVAFADSGTTAFGMSFVATDDISVTRSDEQVDLADQSTTFAWSVSFGYQQVA